MNRAPMVVFFAEAGFVSVYCTAVSNMQLFPTRCPIDTDALAITLLLRLNDIVIYASA